MEYVFRPLSANDFEQPGPGELLISLPHKSAGDSRAYAQQVVEKGTASFPQGAGPIERIILSDDPTIDDLLAAEFISWRLAGQELPKGANAFASYSALARAGLRPGNVALDCSLEGIFLAMRSNAEDFSNAELVAKFMADWRRLADRIMAASRDNIDPSRQPFLAEGTDFALERAFLLHDYEVFQQDVARGEEWTIQMPDGPPTATGLLLRKPKSLLFKYWSRDPSFGREGKPYLFLAVDWGKSQWVFSTDPVQRISLKALHEKLQGAEEAADPQRSHRYPWFDGEVFKYCLIAGPKHGTVLADKQILTIVREWLGAKPIAEPKPTSTEIAEKPTVESKRWGQKKRQPVSPGDTDGDNPPKPPIKRRTLVTAGMAVLLLGAGITWYARSQSLPSPSPDENGRSAVAERSNESAERGLTPSLPQQFDGGHKWAIVIGINNYTDRDVPKLNCCVADAKLLSKQLTEHCGYDPDRVLLMTDDAEKDERRPRLDNLQQQVSDLLALCQNGDTVLVFFAGHGTVDEGGAHYLMPQDYKQKKGTLSAWSTDELRKWLHTCKATQKLLVLDCCHSGTGVRSADNKPVGPSSEKLGESFQKAKGLITIASCQKNETSKEWSEKHQGLFTYFLAEGLAGAADSDHNGIVDSFELYNYVLDKVPLIAQTELNTTPQTPVLLMGEDVVGRFALARVSVPVDADAAPDLAPCDEGEMRRAASDLRQKLLQEISARRTAKDWIALNSTGESAGVWTHSQGLASALGAAELSSPQQQLFLKGLDVVFGPETGVDEPIRKKFGWPAHLGIPYTQAEPAAWTAIALTSAIDRYHDLPAPQLQQYKDWLEETQEILETYRSTPFTGNWNTFPNQKNGSAACPYTSALVLDALLKMKDAKIPWKGSVPQREELINETATWLIGQYDASKSPAGWRATTSHADSVCDGITLQIYATLLRAERSDVELPPEMVNNIFRHLMSCARRPVDFPNISQQFSEDTTTQDGKPYVAKDAMTFYWHPWAIACAVEWLQFAGRHQLSAERTEPVRRLLGYLVMHLGSDAVENTKSEWTHVATELLYGLDKIPSP